MWCSFWASIGADVLRQVLKRKAVTNSGVHLALVAGLCLGAASLSLAQITQDAYVTNVVDNTV